MCYCTDIPGLDREIVDGFSIHKKCLPHVCPPAARAAAARSPRCPPPGMNSHRKAADLRSTLLWRRRHPNPVSRCGRTAVEVFDLSFGGKESGETARASRNAAERPRAPFGEASQSSMLASATTPPGFPLVWEGVPTANYTMVGYDAGMLNIQVNA